MQRCRWLVVVACLLLGTLSTSAQSNELPTALGALQVDGVTIEVLASPNVLLTPGASINPLLTRLGATNGPVGVLVGNTEIWYAESGRATLSALSFSATEVPTGGTLTLPPQGDIYDYEVEGAACPLVYRFQIQIGTGMVVETGAEGPALGGAPGSECLGDAELNSSWLGQPVPDARSTMVLAEVTLAVNVATPEVTLDGPVVLAVTGGVADVLIAGNVPVRLGPGSSITVPAGTAFSTSAVDADGATLLLGAVLPAEIAAAAPPPAVSHDYTSPGFGYSVDWPDTWSVTENTSANGTDTLLLTNGVSTLYFYGFASQYPDAFSCVAAGAGDLNVEAGYEDLQVLQEPIGDPDRVRAEYLYHWTGGGTPAQFVSSLECQMLANGNAVYISHIAPAEQLEAEQAAANEVIASLVLPEN